MIRTIDRTNIAGLWSPMQVAAGGAVFHLVNLANTGDMAYVCVKKEAESHTRPSKPWRTLSKMTLLTCHGIEDVHRQAQRG